jgi:uncharacterized protein
MKRIAWIVLGWSVLLTTTQAASFDCEKASNHVEALIRCVGLMIDFGSGGH